MVSSIGSKQQSSSSISETENSSRLSESDNHPRQYKKRQSGRPQSEVPPQGPPMLSRPHSEVPLGGPLSTRPLSEIRSVAHHNSRERSMLSPKSQRSIHSVDRQSLFKHELPPYHEVPHSSQLVAYSAAQRDHRPSRHDLSVKADISRNGSNGKLSRRSLLSVQSQYMKENSPPRYNPPPIRPGMERYRVKDSQSSLSDRYEPAVVLRNRANPPRISTTEGRRMPPTGEQNRNSSIHQYLFRRQREMCNYVDSIKTRIPIPQDCTVSGTTHLLLDLEIPPSLPPSPHPPPGLFKGVRTSLVFPFGCISVITESILNTTRNAVTSKISQGGISHAVICKRMVGMSGKFNK